MCLIVCAYTCLSGLCELPQKKWHHTLPDALRNSLHSNVRVVLLYCTTTCYVLLLSASVLLSYRHIKRHRRVCITQQKRVVRVRVILYCQVVYDTCIHGQPDVLPVDHTFTVCDSGPIIAAAFGTIQRTYHRPILRQREDKLSKRYVPKKRLLLSLVPALSMKRKTARN